MTVWRENCRVNLFDLPLDGSVVVPLPFLKNQYPSLSTDCDFNRQVFYLVSWLCRF